MPLMPCRNESFGRTYFFWGPPLSGPGFTTWSIRPRVFWRVVSEKDGKEWMTMNPKKHISSIGETKAAILWVITPKWFPASYFSGSSSNNTFLWVTICKFPPKTWKTLFCDMVFKENYYIHLPIINGPQVFPLGNFFFGGGLYYFPNNWIPKCPSLPFYLYWPPGCACGQRALPFAEGCAGTKAREFPPKWSRDQLDPGDECCFCMGMTYTMSVTSYRIRIIIDQ